MLNPDWRNLAENAREFDIRSSMSRDFDNELGPILALFVLGIPMGLLGFSYYYYSMGSYFLSSILVAAVPVFLIYRMAIFSLLLLSANLAFLAAVFGFALYLIYSIGCGIVWVVDSEVKEDKQEQSALPSIEKLTKTADSRIWEAPSTLDMPVTPDSFEAINPGAWNGTNTGDPLAGLVPKSDTSKRELEPGFIEVPCEGPLGKDVCIVKDPKLPEEDLEEPEPPSMDAQAKLPMNTYL